LPELGVALEPADPDTRTGQQAAALEQDWGIVVARLESVMRASARLLGAPTM
jgi:hypothetical protein